MKTFEFLDTLDDYLGERDDLFSALSRANLLLTRFKLNNGNELPELRKYEHENVTTSTSAVRNRLQQTKESTDHVENRILTKADQVNELRTVFYGILHNRLIPLAALQSQIQSSFK